VRETRDVAAMLVYDGDCDFCTRCARWLDARAHEVEVVPWQALDLAEVGLTEEQVRAAAYWLEGTAVVGGERAVARSLVACGRGYAVLGRAVLLPGVRRVAGVGYRFVARHRSRLSAVLR
jgi:predicted DCC family thiol-disulfide oxidoreductase YuxK